MGEGCAGSGTFMIQGGETQGKGDPPTIMPPARLKGVEEASLGGALERGGAARLHPS